MYEYLRGILTVKEPEYAVVDVNGIGFYVSIPLSTFEKLPQINNETLLHIHYHQSQDSVRLFGFLEPSERKMFRLLLSTSGVGPKLALAVLSTLSVGRIVSSILEGDSKTISTVPGLGKKTAQKLIVELKDKVDTISGLEQSSDDSIHSEVFLSAETALVNLGYIKYEVRKSLKFLTEQKSYNDVEKLIKDAIKQLYRKG